MSDRRKLMIVVGEASGDLHAAKLVRALRETEPETEFEFFGAAGPHLREAGVEPTVAADSLAIVGLAEIGRALPMFVRAKRALQKAAAERRPEAAILVDFPDFNLKLAKPLKKLGIKVIYYISPQLWAWRQYRISKIRKYVDLLITILPFEKDWYARRGVDHVEYVGSPLAREVHAARSRDQFCRDHGLDPGRPIISLLPGSRHKEISRILPIMLSAAHQIAKKTELAQFVVAMASDRHRGEVDRLVADIDSLLSVHLIEGETYDALNASDAAAVTSGTATLEAGLIGTPLVVVYKTSAINYGLLEPLISVDHYGLINLIAGERVATELIQSDLTPRSLADELLRLLGADANIAARGKLKVAADKLGRGGASPRAAAAVLSLLK